MRSMTPGRPYMFGTGPGSPAPAVPGPSPSPAFAPADIADRGVTGRVMGTAATVDPIARLPAPAAAKLRDMRGRAAELNAAIIDSGQRRAGIVDRRRGAADNLARVKQGAPRVEVRPQDIAFAEKQLAEITTELAALDERAARLAARRSPIAQRLDEYLQRIPVGVVVEPHDAQIDVKLSKNESATVAIERARERLSELHADLHQVRSSPLPSSQVKAALRRQVADLAARGAPNLMPAIEIGQAIVWPTIRVDAQVQTAAGPGFAVHTAPDTFAVFCWLHGDELIARLEAEVDELADDGSALDDMQRHKREAELFAEILAVERTEEALIVLAEGQGTEIARRDDHDPRAVLGLSAALPGVSR